MRKCSGCSSDASSPTLRRGRRRHHRVGAKNFLEKRLKRRKLRFGSNRKIDEPEIIGPSEGFGSRFMKDIAPAISPPAGIGDTKPTNQAVLDWAREVELLTKPENIFWCDGSERENNFLLEQADRQNVLIKLNAKKVPRSYLHRSNP